MYIVTILVNHKGNKVALMNSQKVISPNIINTIYMLVANSHTTLISFEYTKFNLSLL